MNGEWQKRSEMLIGTTALEKLANSKVAVFGVGGVGGFAVEALARSAVGNLVLVDADDVEATNLNRQIVALSSNIGKPKVEELGKRILDINPSATVELKKVFFSSENSDEFDFESYDYVIDAVDSMNAKLELARICTAKKVPIVSSMGMGNRLDPSKVGVCDIYETQNCPLAKRMRKELRKMQIDSLRVVASVEKPKEPFYDIRGCPDNMPRSPASMIIVPAVAGMLLANVVITQIVREKIQ